MLSKTDLLIVQESQKEVSFSDEVKKTNTIFGIGFEAHAPVTSGLKQQRALRGGCNPLHGRQPDILMVR